jgi:hypothetical protein
VRAIVPLPKGTEVLFPYRASLRSRAQRQESLKDYGFLCNCEICALPDRLSNALDTKIKLVNDASEYMDRLVTGADLDMFRLVKLVDIHMSIIIRERLFFDYTLFFLPIRLLHILIEKPLLRRVGKAIQQVFQRHLGTGVHMAAGVEQLSFHVETALNDTGSRELRDFIASNKAVWLPIHAQIEKMASNIISNLQSLL